MAKMVIKVGVRKKFIGFQYFSHLKFHKFLSKFGSKTATPRDLHAHRHSLSPAPPPPTHTHPHIVIIESDVIISPPTAKSTPSVLPPSQRHHNLFIECHALLSSLLILKLILSHGFVFSSTGHTVRSERATGREEAEAPGHSGEAYLSVLRARVCQAQRAAETHPGAHGRAAVPLYPLWIFL